MSTSDPLNHPDGRNPVLPPTPAPVPTSADPITTAPPGGFQGEPSPAPPVLFPGDRPGRPHPGFFWAVVWCIIFLLVTQLPGAFVAAILLIAFTLAPGGKFDLPADGPDAILSTPEGNISLGVGFFVTELLVIGFSWLIIRLVVGRDWPRQLALRLPSWPHVLLVLAAFPAMMLGANLFYEAIKPYVPSLSNLGVPGMEEMVKVFQSWPWPLAVLLIGVGPGIGEELWCRGFLGRGLVGRYGVCLGVLFSSFFFGLIHVDPAQGTMAMMMGVWLHFTYLMTRSLWVPILLHFLNNSLSVAASHIPALVSLEAPAGGWPWHLPTATLLLLGVVGWALYRSRARLLGATGGTTVWQPLCPPIESPPESSGVRIMTPSPSWLAVGLVLAALAAFTWSLWETLH